MGTTSFDRTVNHCDHATQHVMPEARIQIRLMDGDMTVNEEWVKGYWKRSAIYSASRRLMIIKLFHLNQKSPGLLP